MAFSLLLILVLAAATHEIGGEDALAAIFRHGEMRDEEQRAGGELAALGYCASCHTAEKGQPFAGGRPLATPFGTIFGTNITPDPESGMGLYSPAAFARAMRDGIDRMGRDLYPVFPYNHFTRLEDKDLNALYAFLMTRAAVAAQNRANQLAFPYNVRPLLAGWKLLYLDKFRVTEIPDLGRYLVEGLSHCGACHTPRDRLGAEIASQQFDGGEAEDWWAPPLNANSPSPVPWTEESLFNYLRSWDAEHGGAVGPMATVVAALASVPEHDVRAIAAYVAPIMTEKGGGERRVEDKQTQAMEAHPQGAELYAGICATCHETGGNVPFTVASLGQHTSLYAPDPRNAIHVILEGVHPPEGAVGAVMPAFADTLSDAQIADIVVYLRARFSRARWQNVEDEIARIRRRTSP